MRRSKGTGFSAAKANWNSELCQVLNNTVAFLDCPLTDDQMVAVWEDGYPQAVREALATLEECGFTAVGAYLSNHTSTFVVPELSVGLRFELRGPQPRFHKKPMKGVHATGSYVVHRGVVPGCPVVHWTTFERYLNEGEQTDVRDWIRAATRCMSRHREAQQTIDNLCAMISTPGQLRRMVPDLVGYLSAQSRERIAEQTRASPMPAAWASYPKDRVERLLVDLAEGHLVAGLNRRNVSGMSYSWAQELPK